MMRHIRNLGKHKEVIDGFFNTVAYIALITLGALFLGKIGISAHMLG